MGTAERKEREKAQRREDILNAAKKVFLEKGFREATIEEIANECELSTGTIYLYFKNKDDLYAALNIGPLEFMDQEMTKIVNNQDLSPEDKLRAAWAALYQSYLSDPVAMRAILHFQLEDSLNILHPPRLEWLNERARSFMSKIASILEIGIAEGKFVPTNTTALTDLFWGAFSGVLLWEEAKRRIDPRKAYLESTLEMGFEVLLRGVKKAPSP